MRYAVTSVEADCHDLAMPYQQQLSESNRGTRQHRKRKRLGSEVHDSILQRALLDKDSSVCGQPPVKQKEVLGVFIDSVVVNTARVASRGRFNRVDQPEGYSLASVIHSLG